MNIGSHIEDLVESICTRMFFRDFVVRSPIYQKDDGSPKEAADILVPFRNALIAFQIKAKTESKPASEKTDTDFSRIQRKVDDAIAQLKTIKRAIASNRFTTVRTTRGVDIPFDCGAGWSLIGIVVLDLHGEEGFPAEERTGVYSGFLVEHGMPVHIFLRSVFETIASEIDTMPDFLAYLRARERLYGGKVVAPTCEEIDFLALYKMNHESIQKALSGEIDHLMVQDGIWESYRTRYAEDIGRRDARNQVSYLIDKIIDWFHSGIGYSFSMEDPEAAERERGVLAGEGSVESYLGIITELASLGRIHRRVLAELLDTKMRKADREGHGYGVYYVPDTDTGYLILATDRTRAQRRRALVNMAEAAYCRFEFGKIVGIATENFSEPDRSFDGIVLADATYSEEERRELTELANRVFKSLEYLTTNEFERASPNDRTDLGR